MIFKTVNKKGPLSKLKIIFKSSSSWPYKYIDNHSNRNDNNSLTTIVNCSLYHNSLVFVSKPNVYNQIGNRFQRTLQESQDTKRKKYEIWDMKYEIWENIKYTEQHRKQAS